MTFMTWRYDVFLYVVLLSLVFSSLVEAQVREVHIKAVGGLQFDVVRFTAEPGENIRIVLTNADDMFHNMLFTQPGERESVVKAAFQLAERGPDLEFIPETDVVLWSIGVLGPGETAELDIKAPSTEGIYPYVCTYPGHGSVMYGAMYVTRGKIPDISDDTNIPAHRRDASLVTGSKMNHEHDQPLWHPYEMVPPYWYRIFMPDSGPASIAVNLDDSIFYCWDAGLCRLRYIWKGDFLDISKPWSIKGDASATVLGEVIYRENRFPLDFGSDDVKVEYHGYSLVEGGYPQFYYSVNGVDVYELVRPLKTGYGIRRQFRIGPGIEKLYFRSDSSDDVHLESDLGTWSGKKLEIEALSPFGFEIKMIWPEEKH